MPEMNLKHGSRNDTIYPPTRDTAEHPTTQDTAAGTPIRSPIPEKHSNNRSSLDELREQSIDTDQIAETLENAAEKIEPAARTLMAEPLPEQISHWLDLHGIDRINDETRHLIGKQSAFQLLLKTTLYEYYHQRGRLPALPDDIPTALRRAREETGDAAFTKTVLDEIVGRADADVADDISVHRHDLLATTQPAETIAHIYETLVSSPHRRSLGQYRTLPAISDLMRSWASCGAETVLDPGIGAGALSTPYHPDWSLTTDPDHAVGIDRSPLARIMGATALTISGQSHDTRATDFLHLPSDELPRDADAVIANPPYTDSQTLETPDKHSYRRIAEQETGYDIPAKTPLYAYFLYRSRRFLTEGGRMATITPQAWLATTYGRTLKQFLLNEFEIKALIQLNPETISAFDGPATTGLITFLEASSDPDPDTNVRFIRVDDLSKLETTSGDRDWQPVRNLISGAETSAGDWGFATTVKQENLEPSENWEAQFNPVDIDTSDLSPLGDLLTVSRGPTTGNVEFFCLSEPDVAATGLSERHLTKIVRRPSHIHGYDYKETDWQAARADGKDVWLLDPDEIEAIPDTVTEFAEQTRVDCATVPVDVDEPNTDLINYLHEGVTEHGLAEIKTLQTRQYWYRPRWKPPAEVLVQSAGRDGFRFMLNEASVRNTNACYGFYDIALSSRELKALLAYLNSDVFHELVRQHQRTLDGGFEKIEPRNLERVPVIDPTDLPDETVTILSNAFDELRQRARQGNEITDVITRIGHIISHVV